MNLAEPNELRRFLRKQGLVARKGLGQRFLVSTAAVQEICSRLTECRGLLEIGPGPGVLTAPLSEKAERLVAIELDSSMARALAVSSPRAEIMMADALEVDIAAILESLPGPRGIVSNLPYFITAPLVTRIVEARTRFDTAVLMMQKEVAERLLAPARSPGRGSLSVFVQAQCSITKVIDVPASAFLPPPKVDSTVIELRPLPATYGEGFFEFVRLGFGRPRKTLANCLSAGLRITRDEVLSALESCQIPALARAQELELDEWHRLWRSLA